MVKNPPANAGNLGSSLSWEDALEKEMATHPSILACKSHGQWILEGYRPWVTKSGTRLSLHTHIHTHTILCGVDTQYKHGGWEGRLISSSHPSRPALASEPSFTLHP